MIIPHKLNTVILCIYLRFYVKICQPEKHVIIQYDLQISLWRELIFFLSLQISRGKLNQIHSHSTIIALWCQNVIYVATCISLIKTTDDYFQSNLRGREFENFLTGFLNVKLVSVIKQYRVTYQFSNLFLFFLEIFKQNVQLSL